MKAIFWGGLACAVFDITQAMLAWGLIYGAPPMRILQGVASGLLGRAAREGGWSSAALGALCHCVIAFGAAAVYYLASRRITLMTARPVLAGLIYGELVFWFMQIVVRLSRATPRPWSDPAQIVTGPIGHMFLVGLPIALIVSRFAPLPVPSAAR